MPLLLKQHGVLMVAASMLRGRLHQSLPSTCSHVVLVYCCAVAAGMQCIRQEWTAKDGQAAQQLMQQLQDLAQQQGHAITHTDAVGNTVFAELTTTAQGKA